MSDQAGSNPHVINRATGKAHMTGAKFRTKRTAIDNAGELDLKDPDFGEADEK
jgi:hypothetical protein